MPDASTTILTATYRQAELLREAGASVFGQTRADWRWWIVLDGATPEVAAAAAELARDSRVKVFMEPTTEAERRTIYRPAVIINQYFAEVGTPYIAWLSDDDLLSRNFVEALASELDADPACDVVYGTCEFRHCPAPGVWTHSHWLRAGHVYCRELLPMHRLDGGQVMFTRRAWRSLSPWKIPEGWEYAPVIDGIYLNKLALRYDFRPVPVKVLTRRFTPLSTHTPTPGGWFGRSWGFTRRCAPLAANTEGTP